MPYLYPVIAIAVLGAAYLVGLWLGLSGVDADEQAHRTYHTRRDDDL